jgi:hypothetical protein
MQPIDLMFNEANNGALKVSRACVIIFYIKERSRGHRLEELHLNPLFTAVSHDDISQLNYILNKDLQKRLSSKDKSFQLNI